MEQAIALYDFGGLYAGDLTFRAGERITVLKRSDNGWWEGQIGERHGDTIFFFSLPLLKSL
jgi:hypothetical protein